MAAAQTAGLTVNDTSLGIKLGLPPGNFFKDIGSSITNWIAKGWVNAKSLLKNMADGAKELFGAIARGDWKLFENWLKEDPVAVVAGAGAVLLTAGVVVGLVAAGVGAIGAALAGVTVGGVALTGVGAAVLKGAVGGVQTVYNFDFNKSDAAIVAQINSAFVGLANVAGEATGKALAGFIVGRKEPPKLKIDIKAAATMFLALEGNGDNEIAEEILQELSRLGWAFYRFAKNALFSMGYINFRQWAKKNIKSGIPWVDKMIASWGEEGGKPWVISQQVNSFIETIEDGNRALGNFLEGIVEGFGDGFQDFLELEYR